MDGFLLLGSGQQAGEGAAGFGTLVKLVVTAAAARSATAAFSKVRLALVEEKEAFKGSEEDFQPSGALEASYAEALRRTSKVLGGTTTDRAEKPAGNDTTAPGLSVATLRFLEKFFDIDGGVESDDHSDVCTWMRLQLGL